MASQVPPKKGSPFHLGVSLYTSSGALIASPSSAAAEVAYDFGHFQAVPSSDVVIADSTRGLIQLKLESSHMTYDAVSVFVDDDTDKCVPYTATIYTSRNIFDEALGVMATGTAQQSSSNSLTLTSTTAYATNEIVGATLLVAGGQPRMVLAYDSTSKIATVDAYVTTPSSVAPYLLFGTPPASGVSVPGVRVVSLESTAVTTIQTGLATSTAMSSGFAAQTAILSTMATSIGLRATSTEVSSGFAAQTAALSTMATAIAGISTGLTVDSTAIADAVHNSTMDGGVTFRQMQRGFGAVLLGLVSGSSGSTTVFRDINDTKSRVTAVTDSNGNRTSITLDLT